MRVINNVKSIKEKMKRAAQFGVQKAVHKTMAYANANEVPMDTGRLINSGFYEVWEFGNIVSYKMSYGGSEGLAGLSQFASRLYENIEGKQYDKEGNVTGFSTKPMGKSIYSKGSRTGQLTYAMKWHNTIPPGGFQHDRKYHYLVDPVEIQFPVFLIEELQKSFGSIGLSVTTGFATIEDDFVPDEVGI